MKTTAMESISVRGVNLLETLELKSEWVETICKRALTGYNQTTSHDAMTAPGSYAYFAAVRATRDVLCPHGWEKKQKYNIELTINPANGIGIVVSSGNRDTGKPQGYPRTKNHKGKQTISLVNDNQQLRIWPHLEPKINRADEATSTWMLLYHFDLDKEEMRRELSLPIDLEIDEWEDHVKICGWQSRIIFPPIQFNPSIGPGPDDGETYSDNIESDFDIVIRRRDDK